MKLIILRLMVFITLLGMLYLGKISYDNTEKYINSIQKVTNQVKEKDTLHQMIDRVFADISFGLVKSSEQIKSDIAKIKRDQYLKENTNYLIGFLIMTLIISIVLLRIDREFFQLIIPIISLISLMIAMVTPLALLSLKPDKFHHIGEASRYNDEIKTIISIVQNFLYDKEYSLFMVLLFVAILLPFIQSIIVLIITMIQKKNILFKIRLWIIIENILLISVIFTLIINMKENIKSDLSIESGLYFLIIYIILSILSLFQKENRYKTIRKNKKSTTYDYYS